MSRVRPYLSVCAIYRNEADYLREWIEFHRLVGVERFFLYDNESEDHHEQVLAPYLEDGSVVLKYWPISPGQLPAYDDCLAEQREASRWIAFIDLDEFLFSPTGSPVSEVLVEFERWPGVGANWAAFGQSGHQTRPPGLVIENYLRRMRDDRSRHRNIKSIVDPMRVRRAVTPHHFLYRDGFAVDENHNVLDTPPRSVTKQVSFSLLRVNHYWTRSAEEWKRKLERFDAHLGGPRQNYEQKALADLDKLERKLNEHYDDTITTYAPALRKALGMEPAETTRT
jgi:Glycosyltransferase family 92